MPMVFALVLFLAQLAGAAPPRSFATVIALEATSETSANVSFGSHWRAERSVSKRWK